MSRARELARMGGSTQVVSGVSSFVGVSTFASDVFMLEDLSVAGDLNVTGDLSYDETTATNSRITGVSTTRDLVVTQNADVAGIVSATTFEGNLTGNVTGNVTGDVTGNLIGNVTGNITGVATGADAITVTPELSSSTQHFVVFAEQTLGFTEAHRDAELQYQPSTGTLSATTFSGSLATTDLTGTITNDQLAGSIANDKLSNNSVSYGGVELALGASDATPAFDLSDATSLPISSGVSGLGANVATFLGTPSSANLASAVTDETGSGALVFGTAPTITNPVITGATIGAGDVIVSGGLVVGAGLTVTGDLQVDGTTTTINSTAVSVADLNLTLASNAGNASAANGGGITVGGANATLTYASSGDKWVFNKNVDLGSNNLIATDLDISGNVDVDGTLEADAITVNGTALSTVITNTTVTNATNASNIVSEAASDNENFFVLFTPFNNTESAEPVSVNTDAGIQYNPSTNTLTISAEVDAASLDISGNADIDGTLEADAITVNGTALATVIANTTVTNATNAVNLSGGSVSATTGSFSGNVDIGNATSDTLTVTARVDSDIVPSTNNARALGTSSLRWSNIYSNDLDLSNEGSVNDFDGTWGSYLIQEGEEDLFILNRRNGKKYKFMLQEV